MLCEVHLTPPKTYWGELYNLFWEYQHSFFKNFFFQILESWCFLQKILMIALLDAFIFIAISSWKRHLYLWQGGRYLCLFRPWSHLHSSFLPSEPVVQEPPRCALSLSTCLRVGIFFGTGFFFRMNAARHSPGSSTKHVSNSGTVRPSRISRLIYAALRPWANAGWEHHPEVSPPS